MPLVSSCSPRPAPRRGSAIVEAAFVLPIFFLFTFGIYEYGRYLLVLNITTNAARDAARWAAVHANDGRTADTTHSDLPSANYPLFNVITDTRLTAASTPLAYANAPYGASRPVYDVPFVNDYVAVRSGPVANMLDRRAVWVFAADTSQLYANPAKVMPKTGTSSWKQAAFTERIAVQIVGDFKPVLPTFLFMSDPLPVSVIGLAPSEG